MGIYAKKVQRGTAVLDQTDQKWFEKINLQTLVMVSQQKCILGQLYGWYGTGLGRLNIVGRGVEYGFSSNNAFGLWRLERNWNKVIRSRRRSAAL